MKTDWRDIKPDEILNWAGAQTDQIARYDRIMRHRETVELVNVSNALFDLKGAVHKSSKRLETSINDAAEKQGRAQKVGIVLTWVIAIATVAYAGTTLWSVQTQREANEIQRELLELQSTATRETSIEHTSDEVGEE